MSGNLHQYIQTIIRFYRSPQQQQVYTNYLSESRMISRTYKAYRYLNEFKLGYLVLALHGLRTAGQFYQTRKIEGDLIAFAAEANQHKCITHIASLSEGTMKPVFIPEVTDKFQRIGSVALLAAKSLTPKGYKNTRTMLGIIKTVEQREGWVIALNVSSFLFNYAAFYPVFSLENKIAFTANDFSPIPLAFKAASTAHGLKQIYTMHGQISSSASGNLFPRLDYDLAFLYGQSSLRSYGANGKPTGDIILTGFPGTSERLRLPKDDIIKVGIVLPNYYDTDTHKSIERIATLYPYAAVFVRCHPQMAKKPEFPHNANISLSTHAGLKAFADDCDIMIAGNTGAQIDVLKFGCPVVYCGTLDKLGEDDIGLVREGVIPKIDDKKIDATAINAFFGEGWPEKFRSFDAFYLIDDDEKKSVRTKIIGSYTKLLQSSSAR